MLCVWWDRKGIIHYELLPRNETVTATLYVQQLARVQEKLKEKQPALINRKGVMLLNDNSRPHTARITQEKILDLKWSVLLHLPYSSVSIPPKFPKWEKIQMVTVWWSAMGIIHYNFLNPGETITAEKYCREIDNMHEKLKQLNPVLINRKGSILLHDNARPHVAQLTQQKLNELGYETLPHPAYSPDLSPTDYHFFKHLDHYLQGKIFTNQAAAENAFKEFINSRTTEFYATGINKLTVC
ncbi:Histone-lysine N-methyltransferase SETMAR [Anthophora plagiata]